MSGDAMMGAGGGGEVDFHLAQFAQSVLEFQGSIRAVLNRDTGEKPRSGEIAALLQSFLEKNNFSVAGLVGDSLPLADRASEGEPGSGIAQACAVLNAFPFMHVRLYSSEECGRYCKGKDASADFALGCPGLTSTFLNGCHQCDTCGKAVWCWGGVSFLP